MKQVFLFLIPLFFTHLLNSQSLKILHQSDYKHNYVVGRLDYIEDIRDTIKLKYIATVRIIDEDFKHKMYIENWMNLLEPKVKGIGANMFFLEKYETKDSMAVLILKVFFAGEKFSKENELKKMKGAIYVFDFFSAKNDTALFYLNGAKKTFNPKTYRTIRIDSGLVCNISLTNTPQYFALKKGNISRFLYLQNANYFARLSMTPGQGALFVKKSKTRGVSERPKEDLVGEMQYLAGRLLIDMYDK